MAAAFKSRLMEYLFQKGQTAHTMRQRTTSETIYKIALLITETHVWYHSTNPDQNILRKFYLNKKVKSSCAYSIDIIKFSAFLFSLDDLYLKLSAVIRRGHNCRVMRSKIAYCMLNSCCMDLGTWFQCNTWKCSNSELRLSKNQGFSLYLVAVVTWAGRVICLWGDLLLNLKKSILGLIFTEIDQSGKKIAHWNLVEFCLNLCFIKKGHTRETS